MKRDKSEQQTHFIQSASVDPSLDDAVFVNKFDLNATLQALSEAGKSLKAIPEHVRAAYLHLDTLAGHE